MRVCVAGHQVKEGDQECGEGHELSLILPCPEEDCDSGTHSTALTNFVAAVELLKLHLAGSHGKGQGEGAGAGGAKAEKEKRPTIEAGTTDEDWEYFKDRWQGYKRATKLLGSKANDQLLKCCEETFRRDLYRNTSGNHGALSEDNLLAEIKKLAVSQQNRLINVVKLLGMTQDSEEGIRNYVARLKGQANVCSFNVPCPNCQNKVSYIAEVEKHQAIRGLLDQDSQDMVHGEANKTLDETVKYIEAKESGKRSSRLIASPGGINKLSQYQKSKQATTVQGGLDPAFSEKCSFCGNKGHGARATEELRKEKFSAFSADCLKCGKTGHFARACRSKAEPKKSPKRKESCLRTRGGGCRRKQHLGRSTVLRGEGER